MEWYQWACLHECVWSPLTFHVTNSICIDVLCVLQVLQALTRKFKLSPDVNLASLAHSCPVTLSGADLYALCADAWMVAFKRHISTTESDDGSSSSQQLGESTGQTLKQQQEWGGSAAMELEVRQADFVQALAALTPSLSQEELSRYLAIKQHYDAQQGFAGQTPAPPPVPAPAAARFVPNVSPPAAVGSAQQAPEPGSAPAAPADASSNGFAASSSSSQGASVPQQLADIDAPGSSHGSSASDAAAAASSSGAQQDTDVVEEVQPGSTRLGGRGKARRGRARQGAGDRAGGAPRRAQQQPAASEHQGSNDSAVLHPLA